jgi:hypothetical protein
MRWQIRPFVPAAYASYLSLYLARAFHGLHFDLGLKYPFFAANLRAQRAERYLTYHNRNWENSVFPNSRQSVTSKVR